MSTDRFRAVNTSSVRDIVRPCLVFCSFRFNANRHRFLFRNEHNIDIKVKVLVDIVNVITNSILIKKIYHFLL